MTPKEKAKELVSSFMSIKNIKLSDYSVIYLPAAKQCALIGVNEILKLRKGYFDCTNPMQDELYWQEVKNEIGNL